MPRTPDAVILCGGAGLRLLSVTSGGPKSMACIADRPFLELLLRQLRRKNFDRVILAVGYQSQVIREYFGNRSFGLEIVYSTEATPLGTGGALRQASSLISSDCALVMNGDSYTDVDLQQLVMAHCASGADVSVVVVPVDGRVDCGSVKMDADGRIFSFEEKQSGTPARYLNAGVYVAPRQILCDIPTGEISLERALFPQWLADGRQIRAFIWPGRCVDIGTPERYWNAQELLGSAETGQLL